MADTVMQVVCGQNTKDPFTRVYMYNIQDIVLFLKKHKIMENSCIYSE